MVEYRDLSVRNLEALLALDRERHFGRAARSLGISQPSLSEQIRRVEEAVGAPLFERRPARPTELGRVFVRQVARSLTSIETGIELARAMEAGEAGRLRIGFTASAVFSPMSRLVAAFRSEAPRVRILLTEASTAAQLSAVEAGELDIGFVRQFRPRPGIRRRRILREPFVAVVPEQHRLAAAGSVAMSGLAGEPFVHFPRSEAPDLHDELAAATAAAGFTPNVVQSAEDWTAIIALVEAGVGISLVPRSLRSLARPGIRYLSVEPETVQAEVFAVFRDEEASPPVARFESLLVALGKEGSGES